MTDVAQHVSYGVIPVFVTESGTNVYLLVQNHGGWWGFPKGQPDAGETPKQTARREAYEEIGLEISEDTLADSLYYEYRQPIAGKMELKRIVLFPVRVQSQDIVLQDLELQAWRWVDAASAATLINNDGIAELLDQLEHDWSFPDA